MQVKKFEARTVKEALELVKNNLGPDAIILAVRDINNRFGLAGEGSVEVTAAVSDVTLRKKHFAESRMNDRAKESFQKAPARVQKQFIDKMVQGHTPRKEEPRKMTSRPYIEIDDEQPRRAQPSGRNVSDMLQQVQAQPAENHAVAMQRIRSAARDAWNAVQDTVETKAPESPAEIQALKAEITALKQVIHEFRQMPQKFVSSHPGADVGIPYELSFMYEKLETAGIMAQAIQEILLEAQKELPVMHMKNKSMVEAWVAKYLLNKLVVSEKPFAEKLHAFVGGAGQGKTAMLVKWQATW